jgi:hypothetical protein
MVAEGIRPVTARAIGLTRGISAPTFETNPSYSGR